LLRKMVLAGWTGLEAGRGFYAYPRPVPSPSVGWG
jgi:hypothetical protein